jgi:hypothetical protein
MENSLLEHSIWNSPAVSVKSFANARFSAFFRAVLLRRFLHKLSLVIGTACSLLLFVFFLSSLLSLSSLLFVFVSLLSCGGCVLLRFVCLLLAPWRSLPFVPPCLSLPRSCVLELAQCCELCVIPARSHPAALL